VQQGEEGLRLGYFDCFAGASGDMILASLFDVGLDGAILKDGLRQLGIRGIEITAKDIVKKGIRAKSFSFVCDGGPKTGAFKDIVAAIEASSLGDRVKAQSIQAFDVLAEAEAKIHGTDKAGVHFHEVGSIDSVVDVVGSFIGFDALGLDELVVSPLALGTGHIECEHGILPSPAPATLEIARGLPVRGWQLDGELTTPTGAAILRVGASAFGPIPAMTVTGIGYGAGTRDLQGIPNVIRLVVGEAAGCEGSALERDRVTVLETNIDDMNPQFLSHIYDDLFAAGALDVWVENVLMKKGRPGFLLGALAAGQDVPRVAGSMLSGTTSSGVRLRDVDRVKLPRRIVEVPTRFGAVKVKVFSIGSRERCAPEYDDCLRVAKAQGVPVSDVVEEAKYVFRKTFPPGQ
jgi:hypothetical protein